ncbi:MAG: hypothetical protein A2Y38_15720 [Spirochaetes bacterium GWB1_59_5]|nr:MAG: hypothetical protein A2Y38_15720 [Spirochaetes bacterium GWB1_59_5]
MPQDRGQPDFPLLPPGVAYLGDDQPWPLVDVLERLTRAAEHLLHDHCCDTHGWEEVATCIKYAQGYVAQIRSLRGRRPEPEGTESTEPVIGQDTDGTPLYEGRTPIEDRPHVGEVWDRRGDELTIIAADPWGRSFDYTRKRPRWDQAGKQEMVAVLGSLGGSELEGPGAARKLRDADPPWRKTT